MLKKIKKFTKNKNNENSIIKSPNNQTNDIWSIMDKTCQMSMFYSGVEQELYYNILYNMDIRNFLISYHYVQHKRISLSSRFADQHISLFVDSGAHTYQNDPKYFEYTADYWEEHIQKYLKWAEKNKQYIFAIANADFELLLGSDVVDRWNREYFEPFMIKTGVPVCFVWHENSKMTWEQYCQRYPYVGFSSNAEGADMEFSEYVNMLKTAEKYDSLVHGFGMTRTSILPYLPYYTVDSTTWLSGLKYGELNFWDTTKNRMLRLKKDKWKGDFFNRIMSSGYPFDPDRLLNEDMEEIIKANIYPFIQAEKYIQFMHRKIIYWQRPKPTRKDINRLPEDFFPTPEWLETNGAWWLDDDIDDRSPLDYARKMNLSTSPLLSRDTIKMWVCYMTIFLNWDKSEYQDLRDRMFNGGEGSYERLKDLHDTWINKIVRNENERVQDLYKMFRDNFEGIDTKLLLLGTNFDRVANERDMYIDDKEFDQEDIPEDEVIKLLSNKNLLPPPKDEGGSPEIDILDDEIFSDLGLTTERHDNGSIIKWARHVPRPKKLYSDKYPKLACDLCFQAQRCPEYKPSHVCAYNKMFQRYDTRNVSDLMELMQGMVDLNAGRMQRAMIYEIMSGGHITKEVSNLINQNVNLIKELKALYQTSSPELLKQTRVIRADGSTMEETSLSGGVLAQLMASMLNKDVTDKDEQEKPPQNNKVVLNPDIVDAEVIEKIQEEDIFDTKDVTLLD